MGHENRPGRRDDSRLGLVAGCGSPAADPLALDGPRDVRTGEVIGITDAQSILTRYEALCRDQGLDASGVIVQGRP